MKEFLFLSELSL